MIFVEELQGRWRRSLFLKPDGHKDQDTWVVWLQAPSLFADLRQPANRPSFQEISSLCELRFEQIEWMAGQEGFAGRFGREGEVFEWRRLIDFQPAGETADRARLFFEGDMLVEEGVESAYTEHWHREAATASSGALLLRDPVDGRIGIFAVADDRFMCARGRAGELPKGAKLQDCVRAAGTLEAAQNLVDCEISFGFVQNGVWRIERSTLPFREGNSLQPLLTGREELRFHHSDKKPDGEFFLRGWDVVEQEGDLSKIKNAPEETAARDGLIHAIQEPSP